MTLFVKYAKEYNPRHLTRDMMSYKKSIYHLFKKGSDWSNFDRHFRKLQARKPFCWASPMYSLLHQYGDRISNKKPFHSSGLSKGQCYNFHTKGKSCSAPHDKCKYSHACPRCKEFHPKYDQCTSASKLSKS